MGDGPGLKDFNKLFGGKIYSSRHFPFNSSTIRFWGVSGISFGPLRAERNKMDFAKVKELSESFGVGEE